MHIITERQSLEPLGIGGPKAAGCLTLLTQDLTEKGQHGSQSTNGLDNSCGDKWTRMSQT